MCGHVVLYHTHGGTLHASAFEGEEFQERRVDGGLSGAESVLFVAGITVFEIVHCFVADEEL